MKLLNRTPLVVITNSRADTGADYSEAEAFGKLVAMSTKLYSFTPNSPANVTLSKDMGAALDSFDPEIDYVLPSGSSLSTGLFLVGLFARGVRKVKVLMWNGNDQSYHGGVLDLSIALEPQNV